MIDIYQFNMIKVDYTYKSFTAVYMSHTRESLINIIFHKSKMSFWFDHYILLTQVTVC